MDKQREDYLARIKKEIDDVLQLPSTIKDGDITLKDIMRMYGVSDKTSMRIMKLMAEKDDNFEIIKVRSPEDKRPITVLRRRDTT